MTHEEKLKVNGSGLFFFKSDLSDKQKLKILKWHETLTKEEKEYVAYLMQESKEEAEFFAQSE